MLTAFLGGAGAAVAFMLTMTFCNMFKSKKEDAATALLRERNELTRETNEYLSVLARACHDSLEADYGDDEEGDECEFGDSEYGY